MDGLASLTVLGIGIIPLILIIVILVKYFELCKTIEEIKEIAKSQEQFLFSISAKLNKQDINKSPDR